MKTNFERETLKDLISYVEKDYAGDPAYEINREFVDGCLSIMDMFDDNMLYGAARYEMGFNSLKGDNQFSLTIKAPSGDEVFRTKSDCVNFRFYENEKKIDIFSSFFESKTVFFKSFGRMASAFFNEFTRIHAKARPLNDNLDWQFRNFVTKLETAVNGTELRISNIDRMKRTLSVEDKDGNELMTVKCKNECGELRVMPRMESAYNDLSFEEMFKRMNLDVNKDSDRVFEILDIFTATYKFAK